MVFGSGAQHASEDEGRNVEQSGDSLVGSDVSPTSTAGTQNASGTATAPTDRARGSILPPYRIHHGRVGTSTRHRGYSLRRSIFAQNIEKHATGAPIEMAQPATATGQTEERDGVPGKRPITITVTEPIHKRIERPLRLGQLFRKRGPGQTTHSSVAAETRRVCSILVEKIVKSKPLPPSPDGRHVTLSCAATEMLVDERTNKAHIDNTIISCRYTPWNFVPRQLVAQFGKLANFYFLCIAILQMIPGLSTTGTYTTIVPLLLFVGLSMAKEGYDDLRRHRLDKEDNDRDVYVLERRSSTMTVESPKHAESGYPETTTIGWRSEKWHRVTVGDVVMLSRDEPVPADVILLHADEPTGSAFIETKSLDGETNLKSKKPPAEISSRCHDLDSVAHLEAEFVVEDPNLDLYKFDGRVSVGDSILPLTNNEVIYRGSVVRNTPFALGLVIYSGEECKIRMNANKRPRIKAPALQAKVNKVVIFVAALVFAMAFLLAGLYEVWRQSTERKSWFLTSARVPWGRAFVAFIIMFNTMLPLSLYVSLEIVKVAQMFMMNDIDMYDSESDTPMEPHTSTINEELGQVNYIFSDKTGTLTNNSMKFRKISIAGTAWLHNFDLQEGGGKDDHPQLLHKERAGRANSDSRANSTVDKPLRKSRTGPAVTGPAPTSAWKSSAPTGNSPRCGNTVQLLDYLQKRPQSAYSRRARFFILALALCHTCVPEKDDVGDLRFQAASPDELALISAATELGYIVTDRSSTSITIKTYPGGQDDEPLYDVYEVLNVIEFSSSRRRMSIVVRFPDHRICLITKGADATLSKLLRLAELAEKSASTVQHQASIKRSTEAQEVLRRRSMQPRTPSHRSRSSISIREGDSGFARTSSVSGKRRSSARDSVDQWLKDRESEGDTSITRRSTSFYTPRQSFHHATPGPSVSVSSRPLVGRSDSATFSPQVHEVDGLVDASVTVDEATIFEHCFQHIDDFASEGLRTLLYGYRYLSDEEYQQWRETFDKASTSLENRQEKMEAAGEVVETNLELLGATAIEDKLQQGVPDAIDRFRRAGIKVWMLTGDKRETAINIGYSCRLIKEYSTVLTLDHRLGVLRSPLMEAVKAVSSDSRTVHSVLVVDGQSLSMIDADAVLRPMFTEVAIAANSVICCRASPSQKASLVKRIRTTVKNAVTLAIGDGANDVAMLLEADVGIGIAGKEGLQAARISDYSIAQFRFLLKLLLVHGRWNYVRICKYTLGTFWKEMLFYLVQAMYQRWNGYTGTSFYEPWSLTMFNTLFTSLPVIFMGIFEKDLSASTLLAVPELYSLGRENQGFSFALYAWWAGLGAAEAVIVFFIVYGLFGEASMNRDDGIFATGCLAFSICVTLISTKLQVIELHNKTTTAISAFVLSVGGWFVWNLILSSLYNKFSPIYDVWHGFTGKFGRDLLWWLTFIVGVMAIVLLEIGIKSVRSAIHPTDTEVFQALEHDIEVRKRFEEAASDLLQQPGGQGRTQKSNSDSERETREQAEREAQVQELLERPRTEDSTALKESIHTRHSIQAEGVEDSTAVTNKGGVQETRRSVDIAELFKKGFGSIKQGQELK